MKFSSGCAGDSQGEKTLGSLAFGLLATGREVYNGEKLFGQDQLVLASHPQQVTLAGMLDFDSGCAAKQLFAVDTGPFHCVCSGRTRGRGFGLRVHCEAKYKREWIALFSN